MAHSVSIDTYAAALAADALGYASIPLLPGSKAPAIRWRQWQTERPTAEHYRSWFVGTRRNIALVCGDLIVVDVDCGELLDFALEQCGVTPSICRTPRGGFHLHYRARKGVEVANRIEIKGRPIDLRCRGAYAVIPPSARGDGVPYAWLGDGLVELGELPVFRVGWIRERTTRRVRAVTGTDQSIMVRRARAYLACVEGAVAGGRGHDKTFRVACVLAHKFALTFEQAWPLLLEWNSVCEPPWSETELEHKLRDALRKRSG